MPTRKLTVPPGGRILHIGPHKTGTTALQGAFHTARERLAAHGVLYPGTARQPVSAALAKIGVEFPGPSGTPVREHLDVFLQRERPRAERWEKLCAEVAAAEEKRVVISTEYFSNAGDEAAHDVVQELGGDRLHVVVTLRSLLKILPSQWQQYVRNGLHHSYEEWLDAMFRQAPYVDPTPSFWRRHRHDALVRRWARAAGPENVTVLVQDETDQEMQLRVFEELAGLPDGFLAYDGRDNRSLTRAEVEMVLQLNKEAHDRGWSQDRYGKVIRAGALRRMRDSYRPGSDEPRVTTPEWAVAEAAALGEEMSAAIAGLGVRVIGDPATLAKRPSAPSAAAPDRPVLPSAVAAEAVLGGILAAGAQPDGQRKPTPAARQGKQGPVLDRPVRDVDAKTLLRIVAGRGLRRFRR
ncbi:hypothetical protein N566_04625 [Streptomycetaceae bacterium MP113-05]|nr:hypothetical protein N566_04625 [Streptomycetaceae bacterium MP113-05]